MGSRRTYRAELPVASRAAPSGPEWLHELEYDGARIGCFLQHGAVRLVDHQGARL